MISNSAAFMYAAVIILCCTWLPRHPKTALALALLAPIAPLLLVRLLCVVMVCTIDALTGWIPPLRWAARQLGGGK